MNTVIKSEKYRLVRSKEVWTMLIALAAVQIIAAVAGYFFSHSSFMSDSVSLTMETAKTGFFQNFANTANGAEFSVLMVIMVCSLVTKLYQTGVNKQLVSCGINRNSVVLGQFFSMTAVFSVVALIISVVSGIISLVQGGGLGLEGMNVARLLLSTAGMVLVVASMTAMFLMISHLTGSMGAATALGLVAVMGLSSAVFGLSMYLKCDAIYQYYLNTVQFTAVSMDVTLTEQLTAIGVLAAYTAAFLVLAQVIFRHKEIK